MLPDSRFRNYRILVVEDEQRMARFIRLNLEHDGFRVIEAYDGTQALDKLRIAMPDLVLLDVMLPDFDGFEVLKTIRGIQHRTGDHGHRQERRRRARSRAGVGRR